MQRGSLAAELRIILSMICREDDISGVIILPHNLSLIYLCMGPTDVRRNGISMTSHHIVHLFIRFVKTACCESLPVIVRYLFKPTHGEQRDFFTDEV